MPRGKLISTIAAVLLPAALAAFIILRLVWHFSVNYPAPIPPARAGTLRVACVGDSSTYGMFLWDRAATCYPAKLQRLMGAGASVRNFGANSTTVLATGDHPYADHKNYARSGDFAPDIVLVMLGTNDAKPDNWTDAASFAADYRALLDHYAALPSHPAVYAMTPPAVILRDGKAGYDIDPQALADICDTIRAVAGEAGLPLIDIQALTQGQPQLFIGLDGVHLNGDGTALVARAVYDALEP